MLNAKISHMTVTEFRRQTTPAPHNVAAQSGGNLADLPTLDKIKAALTAGYLPAVERANDFIRHIESSIENLPATSGLLTVRGPFGGRADMGAWLAGAPDPMRRRARRATETAPVKVIVGNFVSYGVSAADYQKRSGAIIAFLLLVQRYRPVELYCSIESNLADKTPVFGLVALESKPLNLSETGFVIGHPAFSRVWGFSWLEAQGVPSSIPCLHVPVSEKRTMLGLADCDVYINSLSLHDPLKDKPIEWIKSELARIGIE